MSNDLNKHCCIGRIGQDIELKMIKNSPVVNIGVACHSSWMNKNTGQKEERTTWINYVAFGKLAEIMAKYLHKGSTVYLEGELRNNKWEDQAGVQHNSTEIVARQMQMLDGTKQQPQQQQPCAPAGNFDSFDDDIPFDNPYKNIEYIL